MAANPPHERGGAEPAVQSWRLVRPAQVAAGVASTALGITVVVAWILRDEALTRIHPLFPPMPYTLALGLLLCGLALLARAGGWLRLAGVSAAIVFAIGLVSLVNQSFGLGWNVHLVLAGDGSEGAMAPSSALSLVLVGVGLIAASLHPLQGSFACAISGTTVAVQRSVAFIGYSFGITGSYLTTGNAPHVDLGLAIVGIGTIAAAWDRGQEVADRAPRWLPLPVALGVALISVSLWYQATSDQRATLQESTQLRAQQLGIEFGRRGASYADALAQIAAAAGHAQGSMGLEPRALAALDLERFPGLSGVMLLDADLAARWTEVQPSLRTALPELRENEPTRRVLEEAARRRSVLALEPVRFPSGDAGFLVVAPIVDNGAAAGFVVGIFSHERFFASAMSAEDTLLYSLQVVRGDRELFRRGAGEAVDSPSALAPLPFLNTSWGVRIWPSAVPLVARSFADGALVFGLMFAGLLGWTVWLSQRSARRRDQLTTAIAARESAEAAQEQSERRFRQIVEAAADIIYRTDAKGRFIFVNPAAIRVTKWSRDDLIGRDYLSLVRPDHQAAVQQFYQRQVVEKLATTYLDFPVVTADGGEVWIGQHVQLLTNGDTLLGFQAVARDISERMRVQRELQRMRDAALEAARLKSDFVANTSHEVRTPLNGILGFASLLRDTDLTEEQRAYADGLKVSADALLAIVNDILDLSKVEAGMLTLETVSFDLRTTIDHAVVVLAEAARQRELALNVHVDPALPRRVKGDPSRLRQVLTNLIANAVKFTDRGSISVDVVAERQTERDIVARFSITDTGIGISADAQSRLFQPFVQADGSTGRRYGGTGLGLAISRQIVELFGGSISVESAPGSGSTFSFTVNLEKDADAVPADVVLESSLEGTSVLLVVDAPSLRGELVRRVTQWGMTPGEALNAADALDRLYAAVDEGRPYRIVILGLGHPHEDGLALARRIKSDPRLAESRLVLIPFKGMLGDARAARDTGIAAYLPQPVDGDELLQCLRAIMAPPEGRSGHARRTSPLVTRHVLEERRNASCHRILVADDNPVSLQVTRLLLEKLGYVVEAAGHGAEAVQASAGTAFALILMDCQMPVLDGYAATAEIRRQERGIRHTPIVAFTASAGADQRQRCLQAGMDDFLEKPIRKDQLLGLLQRWLPASPAGTENVDGVADTECPLPESIDPATVSHLEVELGADTVKELFDRHVEQTERALEIMARATGDDDVDQLVREAHRLKGSSRMLGLVRLGSLCADIEGRAPASTEAQRLAIVEQLRCEWSNVVLWLRKWPLNGDETGPGRGSMFELGSSDVHPSGNVGP